MHSPVLWTTCPIIAPWTPLWSDVEEQLHTQIHRSVYQCGRIFKPLLEGALESVPVEQIINIPNSMTVLPELLPLSLEMSRRGLTGIMNFTNPGAISHNEILELYKQYVDPEFTWQNFTVEEQAKVIKAPRSNNLLDTARVWPLLINMNSVGVELMWW
jgi:hypothetical protein